MLKCKFDVEFNNVYYDGSSIAAYESTYANFIAAYAEDKIREIDIDSVTGLKAYAFKGRSKLEKVTASNCKVINSSAFADCTNLQFVSFPICSQIYGGAFNNCIKLTSVYFPSCSWGIPMAFSGCTHLETINFPLASSIFSSAFCSLPLLKEAYFAACSDIRSSAFYGCSNLCILDIPNCMSIHVQAFGRCGNLTQITLRGSSVCYLAASTAFSLAGITPNTGSIYVPASLVDSYKQATNWIYFSNIIHSISAELSDI